MFPRLPPSRGHAVSGSNQRDTYQSSSGSANRGPGEKAGIPLGLYSQSLCMNEVDAVVQTLVQHSGVAASELSNPEMLQQALHNLAAAEEARKFQQSQSNYSFDSSSDDDSQCSSGSSAVSTESTIMDQALNDISTVVHKTTSKYPDEQIQKDLESRATSLLMEFSSSSWVNENKYILRHQGPLSDRSNSSKASHLRSLPNKGSGARSLKPAAQAESSAPSSQGISKGNIVTRFATESNQSRHQHIVNDRQGKMQGLQDKTLHSFHDKASSAFSLHPHPQPPAGKTGRVSKGKLHTDITVGKLGAASGASSNHSRLEDAPKRLLDVPPLHISLIRHENILSRPDASNATSGNNIGGSVLGRDAKVSPTDFAFTERGGIRGRSNDWRESGWAPHTERLNPVIAPLPGISSWEEGNYGTIQTATDRSCDMDQENSLESMSAAIISHLSRRDGRLLRTDDSLLSSSEAPSGQSLHSPHMCDNSSDPALREHNSLSSALCSTSRDRIQEASLNDIHKTHRPHNQLTVQIIDSLVNSTDELRAWTAAQGPRNRPRKQESSSIPSGATKSSSKWKPPSGIAQLHSVDQSSGYQHQQIKGCKTGDYPEQQRESHASTASDDYKQQNGDPNGTVSTEDGSLEGSEQMPSHYRAEFTIDHDASSSGVQGVSASSKSSSLHSPTDKHSSSMAVNDLHPRAESLRSCWGPLPVILLQPVMNLLSHVQSNNNPTNKSEADSASLVIEYLQERSSQSSFKASNGSNDQKSDAANRHKKAQLRVMLKWVMADSSILSHHNHTIHHDPHWGDVMKFLGSPVCIFLAFLSRVDDLDLGLFCSSPSAMKMLLSLTRLWKKCSISQATLPQDQSDESADGGKIDCASHCMYIGTKRLPSREGCILIGASAVAFAALEHFSKLEDPASHRNAIHPASADVVGDHETSKTASEHFIDRPHEGFVPLLMSPERHPNHLDPANSKNPLSSNSFIHKDLTGETPEIAAKNPGLSYGELAIALQRKLISKKQSAASRGHRMREKSHSVQKPSRASPRNSLQPTAVNFIVSPRSPSSSQCSPTKSQQASQVAACDDSSSHVFDVHLSAPTSAQLQANLQLPHSNRVHDTQNTAVQVDRSEECKIMRPPLEAVHQHSQLKLTSFGHLLEDVGNASQAMAAKSTYKPAKGNRGQRKPQAPKNSKNPNEKVHHRVNFLTVKAHKIVSQSF